MNNDMWEMFTTLGLQSPDKEFSISYKNDQWEFRISKFNYIYPDLTRVNFRYAFMTFLTEYVQRKGV